MAIDSTIRHLQWKHDLRNSVRDLNELFQLLALDSRKYDRVGDALAEFPLLVSRQYIDRIQPGNWQDPLLRQVLPTFQELLATPGYSHDPLQEMAQNPVPGIIHKYRDRALMILSSVCPVHCRYCFRRHFDYRQNRVDNRQQTLEYLTSNRQIHELILSGGDPLMLTDACLSELFDDLAEIPHLRRLRIHTRMPVLIPSRVDDSLLRSLQQAKLPVVMVVHVNHPNEIDRQVFNALLQLKKSTAAVLNQAVLLKDINDSAETLAALHEKLFSCGVLPYYLHLLDRVAGVAHFHVGERRARRLLAEVSMRQSGYLVPRLVRETPGMLRQGCQSTRLSKKHRSRCNKPGKMARRSLIFR